MLMRTDRRDITTPLLWRFRRRSILDTTSNPNKQSISVHQARKNARSTSHVTQTLTRASAASCGRAMTWAGFGRRLGGLATVGWALNLIILLLVAVSGVSGGAPINEPINPYPSVDTSVPQSMEGFNLQNTASANRDVDEVFEGVCPIEGTVRDLKIAGNRLMYESRYMEAYDCFKRAMHQWFKPSRIPSPSDLESQRAAMNPMRFKQLFPKSSHLTEDEMATPAGLTRALRQRNRNLFEFRGAPYNPTFADDASAAERADPNGEEEFDENDQKDFDAANVQPTDI